MKYLQKNADSDQSVASWFHMARGKQQKADKTQDPIDNLLEGLSIGNNEPDNSQNAHEDLGEFFRGAPSWLSRS